MAFPVVGGGGTSPVYGSSSSSIKPYRVTPTVVPQPPAPPFRGAPAPAPYNPGMASTGQGLSVFSSIGSAIQWAFTPFSTKQLQSAGIPLPPSPSQDINAISSTFSDVASVISTPADLASAAGWLVNPLHWLRLVEFLGGGVLFLYGLNKVTGRSPGAAFGRFVTSRVTSSARSSEAGTAVRATVARSEGRRQERTAQSNRRVETARERGRRETRTKYTARQKLNVS